MTARHVTLIDVPDLTDADDIHKRTMALFQGAVLPGEPGARRAGSNILWRREGGRIAVYSDLAATTLPRAAQRLLIDPDLVQDAVVSFTATVDASVRVRGRWHPAPDPGEWFEKRVAGALRSIHITGFEEFRVTRRGAPLTQVALHGTAVVHNLDAVLELMRTGLGRSKTFGCGVLTAVCA